MAKFVEAVEMMGRRQLSWALAATLHICATTVFCSTIPVVADETLLTQRTTPQISPTQTAALGQQGIFLMVDGINGGSTEPEHFGWIDLQGWQFGIEAGRAAAATRSVRARTHRLVVLKPIDAATGRLYDLCVKTTEIPQVKLHVVTATASYELTLNRAFVVAIGRDDYSVGDYGLETVAFEAGNYSVTAGTPADQYEAVWQGQP